MPVALFWRRADQKQQSCRLLLKSKETNINFNEPEQCQLWVALNLQHVYSNVTFVFHLNKHLLLCYFEHQKLKVNLIDS